MSNSNKNVNRNNKMRHSISTSIYHHQCHHGQQEEQDIPMKTRLYHNTPPAIWVSTKTITRFIYEYHNDDYHSIHHFISRISNNATSLFPLAMIYLDRYKSSMSYSSNSVDFTVIVTAFILAHKYHHDARWTNRTWSSLSALTLREINETEKSLLKTMAYDVHVKKELYDAYIGVLDKQLCAMQLNQQQSKQTLVDCYPSPCQSSFSHSQFSSKQIMSHNQNQFYVRNIKSKQSQQKQDQNHVQNDDQVYYQCYHDNASPFLGVRNIQKERSRSNYSSSLGIGISNISSSNKRYVLPSSNFITTATSSSHSTPQLNYLYNNKLFTPPTKRTGPESQFYISYLVQSSNHLNKTSSVEPNIENVRGNPNMMKRGKTIKRPIRETIDLMNNQDFKLFPTNDPGYNFNKYCKNTNTLTQIENYDSHTRNGLIKKNRSTNLQSGFLPLSCSNIFSPSLEPSLSFTSSATHFYKMEKTGKEKISISSKIEEQSTELQSDLDPYKAKYFPTLQEIKAADEYSKFAHTSSSYTKNEYCFHVSSPTFPLSLSSSPTSTFSLDDGLTGRNKRMCL